LVARLSRKDGRVIWLVVVENTLFTASHATDPLGKDVAAWLSTYG